MDTGSDIIQSDDSILLTGASGFIGLRVLDRLLDRGYRRVRCITRPSADFQRLNQVIRRHGAGDCVDVMTGNLLSAEDCSRATMDVTLIYHLAAGRKFGALDTDSNPYLSVGNV